MTIIDSQFYIIDILSLDVSLEWNANFVVAWLYILNICTITVLKIKQLKISFFQVAVYDPTSSVQENP